MSDKPNFNIVSEYASIQEYIDILSKVKDRDLPLVVRTKFVKPENIVDEAVDASNPNLSLQICTNYALLELLPLPGKRVL